MTDWTQALCRHADPDSWFPEAGNDRTNEPAKATCWRCPILHACQTWALNRPDEFGIWGALTEHDRTRVRSGHATAADVIAADQQRAAERDELGRRRTQRSGLQPCGTPAAFQRHKYYGEDPCDACKQAQRAYNRERRSQTA